LALYPQVNSLSQITWELLHNVDIINKHPNSIFFQNAKKSVSFTTIYGDPQPHLSEHNIAPSPLVSNLRDMILRACDVIMTQRKRAVVAVEYNPYNRFLGHDCHIFNEDVAEVTPTTSDYWRVIINAERKYSKRSIVMNYVNKCHFGAVQLIRLCYEQDRVWLARRIFMTIELVKNSRQVIFKLTKYTELIKILNKRINLDRNLLIKGAINNRNFELLDWLLGRSFGRRQIIVIINTVNHIHGQDSELLRWLRDKCKTGGRGLCGHLMSIFNEDIARINGIRRSYDQPLLLI
jgi:hypothetical protein